MTSTALLMRPVRSRGGRSFRAVDRLAAPGTARCQVEVVAGKARKSGRMGHLEAPRPLTLLPKTATICRCMLFIEDPRRPPMSKLRMRARTNPRKARFTAKRRRQRQRAGSPS